MSPPRTEEGDVRDDGTAERIVARYATRLPQRSARGSEARPPPPARTRALDHRADKRAIALWLAAAFALSPAVFFILRAGGTVPYHEASWLWPLLILRCAWAEGRDDRGFAGSTRALLGGGALLLLGIALGAIGTSANVVFAARLGIPVTLFGLALSTGAPRPRHALLGLWMASLPTSFYLLSSPWLETALARVAVGIVGASGAPILSAGTAIRVGDEAVFLQPFHSGLGVAWIGAGLGLYVALRRGSGSQWRDLARPAIAYAVMGGLAGLILHFAALLAAAALLVGGAPRLAQLGVDSGSILIAIAAGVVVGELGPDRRGRTEPGDRSFSRPGSGGARA